MKTARRSALPLLVIAAGVLFFANTWGYDLWPADEPRFAEFARDIIDSGDWLLPRVKGKPYN